MPIDVVTNLDSAQIERIYRIGFARGSEVNKLNRRVCLLQAELDGTKRQIREHVLYARKLKRWNAILFMLFLLTLLACSAVMYYTPVAHITIIERPVQESGRI